MTTTEATAGSGRARLALALDVDDAVAALRLARELQPWFGVAKVGLELYSAAGPDIFGSLTDLGYDVFADLKFHDIPTTVARASRVIGAIGVRYLTLHAAGGVPMLAAGVEGLLDGAERAGLPEPTALAVTILTSESDAPGDLLRQRVDAALAAGCGGIVCAASDVATAKRLGPHLIAVVPGIRPAGGPTHDQGRPATPSEAVAAGADLLVIGRAVTEAGDPAAAAAAVAASLAG
ncbi:MAG: orotidine-5'-phosphate decarboxylase [Acidimicrobiales bacterium]